MYKSRVRGFYIYEMKWSGVIWQCVAYAVHLFAAKYSGKAFADNFFRIDGSGQNSTKKGLLDGVGGLFVEKFFKPHTQQEQFPAIGMFWRGISTKPFIDCNNGNTNLLRKLGLSPSGA